MESSIGRYIFVGMCIIGNWKLSRASSIPFISTPVMGIGEHTRSGVVTGVQTCALPI